MNLERIYDKNYKKLLLVPVILLLLSIIVLSINYASTGEVIERDVSLKGGISITIQKDNLDEQEISSFLNNKYNDINVRTLKDLSSRKDIGLIIEASDIDEQEIKQALKEEIGFTENQYSAEEYSATFSESFYRQLIMALTFAFILMAIVVAVTFRTLIPSLAVILAAITNLIVTLAIISLFNVKISSGGIIAFLLVIGYSIDTDVLLTTKLIKRRIGTIYERLKQAMITGLTMTITTLIAIFVAFLFSTAPVLRQIFLIILIALIVDIIATYFGNASILIWYLKEKKK
jgi:preprotein translocase subunit SecF